jgi:hypothetical protein
MQLLKRSSGRRAPRTRSVVIATGLLTIGIAPFGVAATGDVLREGQRNGTATNETQIIGNLQSGTGATGGYVTRQSNLSTTGGGAIYGCRSTAGGSTATPARNPCIRANNLSTGFAFEFNVRGGTAAGLITVGAGGDTKRPFTTNATGVATGLNADRVDGQSASDIVTAARAKTGLDADTVDGADASALRTRWLLINERGQIEEQSGGFTVLDAYQTNQNVYIGAGSSLEGKGFSATISIQNQIDQSGDGTPEPNFGGEVSIARCQTAAVACAPVNSRNANSFVVSPRNSDGTATAAGARKRVYVTITE